MDEASRSSILIEANAGTAARSLKLQRGSVAVFMAARGSTGLDNVRQALGSGRGDLHDWQTEIQDAASMDDPVVVPLYYGETLLAEVPVPQDGGVVRVTLPYNGGALISGGLTIAGSDVDVVAVASEPALTIAERAALSLLPDDLIGVNVGVALPGALLGKNDEERRRQEEESQRRDQEEARHEAAQARAEAQAEAAADRAEQRHEQRHGGLGINLADITVRVLGPELTAAELTAIRREALR